MERSDIILRSEPMEVHFAGFKSTTYALQNAGWRLAVHEDPYGGTVQLLARHEAAGLYLAADDARFNYLQRGAKGLREELPVFVVRRVAKSLESVRVNVDFSLFHQIDATPVVHKMSCQSIEDFALFGPPLVKTEEIIIEPQSVQECLDIIRKLQAPELAEIRKRNAKRERALDATEFHAQILTLAA